MPPFDRASLYWIFGLAPPADAAPDPPQLRPPPVGADLWLRPGLTPEERERARKVGRLAYRSAGVQREVFWKPPPEPESDDGA